MGPGLLESAYEHCVAHELSLRGLGFKRQVQLPLTYKGIHLEQTFRLDFVIEDRLVVELKAVETLLPVHLAQLISYLKLAELPVGLLVNFHSDKLKQGIRRVVNSTAPFAPSRLPVQSSNPREKR
jgi:GxxExxY protein